MLDIHPASEAERIAAFRNVHDVWSGGLSLDEHVQRRIDSLHYQRGESFVGCEDGKVMTSLGCYPLSIRLHGRIEPGMAIAAVHTVAAARGQGFARELIGCVEEYRRRQGVRISLLFSDINPAYYERLGYRTCPSWEGWINVPQSPADSADLSADVSADPIPISPADLLPLMKRLYDRFHSTLPLSLVRDDDYWNWLIVKEPEDLFFRLDDGNEAPAGYLRLARCDNRVMVRDWAIRDRSETSYRLLIAATVRAAASLGAKSVGGWWPDHAVLREFFPLQKREKQITMFKPLDPEINLDEIALTAGASIRQIDHV